MCVCVLLLYIYCITVLPSSKVPNSSFYWFTGVASSSKTAIEQSTR